MSAGARAKPIGPLRWADPPPDPAQHALLVGIGIFCRDMLLMSAMLPPLVPRGVWLGLRLLRRIPERPFFPFATWALALSGVKLLRDGVTG